MSDETASGRRRFPGISPRAFEHPSDRAALTAMRKVPGFDALVRQFVGLGWERALRLFNLASAVRVSEAQLPKVHALYEECLEILDVLSSHGQRPELYVTQDPIVNAGAVGAEKPFIVLNSGMISLLTDDELRHVLGHELGHILSGHVAFKTMFQLLVSLSLSRLGIPLVGAARSAIMAGLNEWDRKSELSADRAGLLCLQDPDAAYRIFMKLAGGDHVEQMNVDAFVAQAEEYETGGDRLDSIIKLFNLLGESHPFWVLRLAQLKRFVDRGEYEALLGGDYPRRDRDDQAELLQEVAESARSYKDSIAESKDPLFQPLRDLGNQIFTTSESLWSSIRNKFGGGADDEDGAEGERDGERAELADPEQAEGA